MRRRRKPHGNLAEFGPALIVFWTFILLPIVALLRFGLALSTLYFVVGQCADAAAKAPTYGLALSYVNESMQGLAHSPMARMTGLDRSPVLVTLYVDEHETATGKTNLIGPNEPVSRKVDTSKCTYDYEVRCWYSFDPLLRSANLPGLTAIPLIGAPLTIDARATQAVEYPDGLRSSI